MPFLHVLSLFEIPYKLSLIFDNNNIINTILLTKHFYISHDTDRSTLRNIFF